MRADEAPPPPPRVPQIFDGYEKEFLEFTAAITRNSAALPSLEGGKCKRSKLQVASSQPRFECFTIYSTFPCQPVPLH